MTIKEQQLNDPAVNDFIERKKEMLSDLYICAGDRSYIVGAQSGLFPDFGHHVKDEMGGVWTHPIKLLDGYWLHLQETDSTHGFWLEEADVFHNYPFYNEHEYMIKERELTVIRRQFCPDQTEGAVVTYEVTNQSDKRRVFQASFLGRTDLSPVWYSDQIGIQDGEDAGELDEENDVFIGSDTLNPWYVVFGSDRPLVKSKIERSLFGPEHTAGQGISGQLTYESFEISQGETITLTFFVAGSNQSAEAALKTFSNMKEHSKELFETKKTRYNEMLSKTAISIPDKQLEKVFNWNKFNMDWLTMEVEGLGRGLAAGHPEYSWWFGCDSSYALLGNLPLGNLELAQETLSLLQKVSETENGNGRIVHEILTSGAVANKGNTQETPHFIKCVWETFLWTGDRDFIKMMYPSVKKGIKWLFEEMDPDHDLLPEGYGIIEIEGLNVELIDTAVYTYEALRTGALMAELMGEKDTALHYQQIGKQLGEIINRDFWLEDEGLYADAMATPDLVLEKIDLYINNAREGGSDQAAAELQEMKEKMSKLDGNVQQPWLFKNWVINTPMETGLAPREQAIKALDRMGTNEFTGPWGTYLSGMYRTHMMTISTSVQAVAECRYDRIDEALKFVNLIASTFNKRLPGSIHEMSPDYGCFVQAWTSYGIVWPLLTHIFGIQPRAYWREVTIRPRLPQGWDTLSVRNVQIGLGEKQNECDISITQNEKETVYEIAMKNKGWKILLDLPMDSNQSIYLDDKEVIVDPQQRFEIQQAEKHVVRVMRL
ncbi:glycogen debranching protein [Fictibacillus sp. WQ 8-8]|uniref:alpha-L-rhamnosidase-related protein n=1 Tax=Fictibacillus sp. WQ 8-8 TaxID=2938788 RepID=UPI002109550A|nr:glycogen debranching protein [Fictibacillus sp. WQ 8-8]MCQ6267926.1 glycogen debranching protein [Fictibacillus sp. WQ 8-8]